MSPKKICRIKNSLKFYLRHIKLVRANLRKSTLSKIYTFLKYYIDFFNNKKVIIGLSLSVTYPRKIIPNKKIYIKQTY